MSSRYVRSDVQDLFLRAIARQSECTPSIIVGMLAALQKLQVKLLRQGDWGRICGYVSGASLGELESFCLEAQRLHVKIYHKVLVAVLKVASRAAGQEGADAEQVAAVRQAVRTLHERCGSCSVSLRTIT